MAQNQENTIIDIPSPYLLQSIYRSLIRLLVYSHTDGIGVESQLDQLVNLQSYRYILILHHILPYSSHNYSTPSTTVPWVYEWRRRAWSVSRPAVSSESAASPLRIRYRECDQPRRSRDTSCSWLRSPSCSRDDRGDDREWRPRWRYPVGGRRK